jgi:hypothetical protein
MVRDANGQALGYCYFEEHPGRPSAGKPLTKDEARLKEKPKRNQREIEPLVLRRTKTTAFALRRTNILIFQTVVIASSLSNSQNVINRIAAAWNADTQQGTHGSRGLI